MQATTTKIGGWRRRGAVIVVLCLFLLAGAAARVQSSSPDVGMITRLVGEATYWNSGDQAKPARVRAFMKIRQGDRVKLPAGALLQILYLAPGRQEIWHGPVTLTVGEGESRTAPGEKPTPPEVKLLPSRVSRTIGGSAAALPPSSLRHSGVITTMGVKTVPPGGSPEPTVASGQVSQQELREAHRTYAALRQQTPADDLTPELYYVSVLAALPGWAAKPGGEAPPAAGAPTSGHRRQHGQAGEDLFPPGFLCQGPAPGPEIFADQGKGLGAR